MYESGILSTWNEPMLELAANEILEYLEYEHSLGYEWISLELAKKDIHAIDIVRGYIMLKHMQAIHVKSIDGKIFIKNEDCDVRTGKTLSKVYYIERK